jgi:hypothetical protein
MMAVGKVSIHIRHAPSLKEELLNHKGIFDERSG